MRFSIGEFYHIYNRGNDKQIIFPQERNYEFFRQKMLNYIVPNCSIVAWCLMPNHFHILIQANSFSEEIVNEKPMLINALTEGVRLLLSSYTKAIQIQEKKTGSLFQQKTKFKYASDYASTALFYIHQNPLRANLVNRLEQWQWSSFNEYRLNQPLLCEMDVAYRQLLLDRERFIEDSYAEISHEVVQKLL
jgi:REP element-mobilizing transposase RayT